MGWTVLYIAFGIVALWLLGEVLLQYKARLRWRLLAFAGFLAVVVGVVVLSSVIVIALGAMAFAVGQTFVTLSYRRGFSTGWALGGMPGSSRRRRQGPEDLHGAEAEPVLEVSGVEEHRTETGDGAYGGDPGPMPQGPDPYDAYGPYQPPAYEPQPMPDDTGEYGVYDRDDRSVFEPAAAHQGQTGYYGQGDGFGHGDGFGQGDGYEYAYGYGSGGEEQHQYAAYSDPYIGYDSGPYAATAADPYGAAGYAGQQGYADAGYGAGPDGWGGAAWVPQQREPEQPVPGPSYPYQDPYAVPGGYGAGYGGDPSAYGYGYPAAQWGAPIPEGGYPPPDAGYGDGYDGAQAAYGYDATTGGQGGYGYDDQRGY